MDDSRNQTKPEKVNYFLPLELSEPAQEMQSSANDRNVDPAAAADSDLPRAL